MCISYIPFLCNASITVSIILIPLTLINGLGVSSVTGFILVPRPAAIIIARFTLFISVPLLFVLIR